MSDPEKTSLIKRTDLSSGHYGSTAIVTDVTISSKDSNSTPNTEEGTGTSYNSSNSTPPEDSSSRPLLPIDQMRSSLTFFQKVGFGVGHVYNDLCAGVWFSYTLLFMQGALQMPGAEAGALVMLGQIGDALATPIVGMLVDKYGTKRQWHIAGTGLVFFTFPLIFAICPWCGTGPNWWQPTYFVISILLFQLGWPIVQVTHLAMIPEISRTRKDRTELTAIRYSASVCANLIVYIVTWAVLHGRINANKNIGPDDAYRFRVSYFYQHFHCVIINFVLVGCLSNSDHCRNNHDCMLSFLVVTDGIRQTTSTRFE